MISRVVASLLLSVAITSAQDYAKKVPVPPGVVTPPGAKCIPPFAECFKEPKKDDLLCCEGAICKPHRQAKKVIKIVCIDKKYVKCTTDKADLSYAPCCEPKVCKQVTKETPTGTKTMYRCAYSPP
ncbi:hypothetical protein KFE25_012649 [Diacronema lutheri]|uniref:Uncharacterized protein n=1 Tax=Diacronema lutheri TaxID=2081491 RepID=A0A8J5X7N6_DIALT|nr:hypothetical protein KFE25_012649 [Diacronema lutheri]